MLNGNAPDRPQRIRQPHSCTVGPGAAFSSVLSSVNYENYCCSPHFFLLNKVKMTPICGMSFKCILFFQNVSFPHRLLHSGLPRGPSMGWESRKHLFKIWKEIGCELSSTMFLETKRREAGPLGKSAVLQVCFGPGSRRACCLHRRGQGQQPFLRWRSDSDGSNRLLGVRSRLCPAVHLGQQQ